MTKPIRIDLPPEVAFPARAGMNHLEKRRAQNIAKLLRLKSRAMGLSNLDAIVELHLIPDYRTLNPDLYTQTLNACVYSLTDLGVLAPGSDEVAFLHRVVVDDRSDLPHMCRMYLLLQPLWADVEQP